VEVPSRRPRGRHVPGLCAGLVALYPGDVEAEPIGEGALRFGARCPQTCRQHRAVAVVKLSDKPPHSGGSPYAAAGRGGLVGGHSVGGGCEQCAHGALPRLRMAQQCAHGLTGDV